MGVATLSDPRLDFLAALHKPKKVTPATVELLDTPGLMPGSHADNPQRLALIREGDALLDRLDGLRGGRPGGRARRLSRRDALRRPGRRHQSRRAAGGEHQEAPARPRAARRRSSTSSRSSRPSSKQGKTVASLGLSDEDKKPMRSFGLLTDKPQVVVLNTLQGQEVPESLRALAPDALAIDAKLELELSQLDPEERAAFMADMGITELGRDRIIRKAYDAVGIITFFTAGEPEVRGWNLERGATAVEAAGKIHTDLAKGFIRAEVTAFDELQRPARSRRPRPSTSSGSKARNTSSRTATSSTSAAGFDLELLTSSDQSLSVVVDNGPRAGHSGHVHRMLGVRSSMPAVRGESWRGSVSRFAPERSTSWLVP